MENAPKPLPETGELPSSHLDSELAMDLWASQEQGGRLSETTISFCFYFPGNTLLCLPVYSQFVLFVLSYKLFFDS